MANSCELFSTDFSVKIEIEKLAPLVISLHKRTLNVPLDKFSSLFHSKNGSHLDKHLECFNKLKETAHF